MVSEHRGRVHRLQRVGLAGCSPTDAVRTPSGEFFTRSNRDGPRSSMLGGRVHAEHMVLMQLQFFGVLDGHVRRRG